MKKNYLQKNSKVKSAVVFNLNEKVLGSKKAQQEPAVIKNPNTGKLVTDVKEIKKISLKYYVDLLTNRNPKPEYEELIEEKKKIHKERMKEIVENDVEFTEEFFHDCLTILKKRNNGKYDFILKSGSSLKKTLFSMFRYIWKIKLNNGEKLPLYNYIRRVAKTTCPITGIYTPKWTYPSCLVLC